ncbi:Autoinducer 2 sensor kinase/phosphatase LuxQ [Anatilimnocola aggregata]|uniref:histidine kinase n=1 Tax=Anatilimnocola aggregata TaxID=2528021 RepID=A0A517YN82_9BACT|nr:ATP-binding protein [Anatilimnocola aggregata]QDU31679.1 Autoinducer 2 sensor kinase/phosphatase LuxQ [Anatilimnocola aggregata]
MHIEPEIDAMEHVPPFPRLCRYLSELSPQPIVAVDGTTHIVSYVNPAFLQLVRKDEKDLVGRPFADAVPEGTENGCLALLGRVFRTGIAENLAEQEHRQLQSRPVYWSYAMWAILGASERPVGVMIQVTDVTETALFRQKSVAMNESLLISATRQHELTEVAEKLSEKLQAAVRGRDHFLAVLSHELRNPLSAFSSGLQLLKLSVGDQDLAEDTREMMERQLKQLVRLVDDLLDISRITTGKLKLHKESVDLASVVRDAVEASRTQIENGQHQLTVALPPSPITLDGDRTRLAQIFLNLLNNAAKYSEPGGSIRLTAKLDGSEVEVSLQDQGIGIPAGKLPHIFEAFVQVDTSWRRTQGGMGIGLSLVKEFVELHGGRVEVLSEGLGQGSEFIVRLPVSVGASVEPTNRAEIPSGPRRRILVVDDNKDAAATLTMMLKIMGHDVRTAHGGEAAVATAEEFRPNLVLMDLGMPKVDGYEAARRIRTHTWGQNIFLVALTGWGAERDRQRTQEVGFDRHLVKPVDMDVLTGMLAEMPVS